MTDGRSEWTGIGNTDFESFRTAIGRGTSGLSSEMAREADGIYDVLREYGLVRLGCAMSWHETKNGTWQGAIPYSHRNPWAVSVGWKDGRHEWAKYSTYTAAAMDWGKRLMDPKGPYAKAVTLEQLLNIYAPPADGNDLARYLKVICEEIDRLPKTGGDIMPPSGNPFRKPKVYDIDSDYAVFGITSRQAKKVGANRFWGRNGNSPEIVVLHVQEGSSGGSLRYWADTAGVQASSTVMIQKDGSILTIIEEEDGPWTNGDVSSPTAKGKAFIDRKAGANPNLWSLSVEAEGFWQEKHPEEQIESICWQVWEWLVRYGLSPDAVYRHSDFNQSTRANCPGTYFDTVMQRIRAKWSGDVSPAPVSWPGKPDWLPEYLIKVQFPEADPTGPRTRSWLSYCDYAGLVPARKAFVQKGTPEELILFEGGLIIDLKGNWVGGDA